MKTKTKLTRQIWLLAFVVILSACVPTVTPTPVEALIGTSVAATMQAQATADSLLALEQRMTEIAMPTATPEPTSTPMPTPTVAQTPETALPTSGPFATKPPVIPQPAPTATATPSDVCLRAILVSETIYDGTVKAENEKFTKTWTFRNNGTCTWHGEFDFAFVSGERMIGTDRDMAEVVEPGGEITISMPMKAPTGLGEHIGFWAFRDPAGTFFGVGPTGAEYVHVSIVVK